MNSLKKLALLGGAGLLAASMATPPALADAVSDFYKGKRITMWIGYTAGGGYDRYARTLARHMGRHIPGNPKFVAKNKPGAGSMILANDMYSVMPQDGTALATIGRGIPMEPLFGNKQAKFDPVKFGWLGSTNNEVSVCGSMKKSGITTFNDTMTKGMIVGGTGKGSDTDTFPTVLNNIVGTKFKLVTGYPGGNDINFAMERGELDGRCGWSWSSVKATRGQWLKSGRIHILLQMSTSKHADLPDVPFVMDMAKNDTERKVLGLVFARQAWGRPFNTTPNVPKARLAALRAAFDATMTDAKYQADMKDKQKLELNPISGLQIEKLIIDLYNSPKEIVALAAKATSDDSATQTSDAVIPITTSKGKITKIKRGGRRVSWSGDGNKGKLRVSGRKTKITIAGKKAKRKALKVGMACSFKVKGVSAALAITC